MAINLNYSTLSKLKYRSLNLLNISAYSSGDSEISLFVKDSKVILCSFPLYSGRISFVTERTSSSVDGWSSGDSTIEYDSAPIHNPYLSLKRKFLYI